MKKSCKREAIFLYQIQPKLRLVNGTKIHNLLPIMWHLFIVNYLPRLALCSHVSKTMAYKFDRKNKIKIKRNASNTLFWALSLAVTLLLGEINVCPTTLCGFHFQSICLTLILPNKKVSARESSKESVANISKKTTYTQSFICLLLTIYHDDVYLFIYC